jgi:hypothetical protein
MTEESPPSPPFCEEDIERFLFSSPAHFVGEVHDSCYQLRVASPSFDSNHRMSWGQAGPYQNSFFALSIRVEKQPPTGKFQIIETYSWMPEQVAVILTAFFGKLIRPHGHIQHGFQIMVPDLTIAPVQSFRSPPFNAAVRMPEGPSLNLADARELIEGYLFWSGRSSTFPKLLSASTFYHLALENWSTRPTLAYVTLVSAVEALLDLRIYDGNELFDERRLKDFKAIEEHVPSGKRVVCRIRSSLYSIRRKFVIFIKDRLPASYFSELECPKHMNITPEILEIAVKAAYDIRSKYLHTGDTTGFGNLAFSHENSEIQLGTPAIKDKKLQKMLTNAPTLLGLERLVSTLLRSEISRWISEIKAAEEAEMSTGVSGEIENDTGGAESEPTTTQSKYEQEKV